MRHNEGMPAPRIGDTHPRAAQVHLDLLRRATVDRRSSFNVIHLATMLRVDVFVLKQREYDLLAFSRAAPVALEEEPAARLYLLSSPEDTVLDKLELLDQALAEAAAGPGS